MAKIGLPSSCCCLTLSTGVKIIAIISIVLDLIEFARFIAGVTTYYSHNVALVLLPSFVELVVSIILLVGVCKQNATLYIPWLVATPIIYKADFIMWISSRSSEYSPTVIFMSIVLTASLLIFSYLVVLAHYKEIKSGIGHPVNTHA